MLTRLEVDGFKNLRSVAIDFGPFTCIAGENGAGKSNVFDAIEFLSLLSSRTLMEAAQELRSTRDNRSGDPRDLFWLGTSYGTVGRTATAKGRNGLLIRLAAEMIVPRDVEDDFGRQARASITFVRYEVDIGYEPASGLEKIGRLVLVREELKPIRIGEAHKHLGFKHSKGEFRDHVVTGRRSGGPFISTQEHEGDRMIVIHQDAVAVAASRSPPQPIGLLQPSSAPSPGLTIRQFLRRAARCRVGNSWHSNLQHFERPIVTPILAGWHRTADT